MGREAVSFMHPGDQGMPEFTIHGPVALPQMHNDHFWPTMPFPPMFNPALGIHWPPKAPMHPTFHAFLSQYVLAGGVPPINFSSNPIPDERSRSSSPELHSPSQLSPSALEALRARTQEILLPPSSPRKVHANS